MQMCVVARQRRRLVKSTSMMGMLLPKKRLTLERQMLSCRHDVLALDLINKLP